MAEVVNSGNIITASVVEISMLEVVEISMTGVGDIFMLGVSCVVDCRGSNITGWLVAAVSFCTVVMPDITSLVTKLGVGDSPRGVSVTMGPRLSDRNSSENPGIV